MTLSVSNADPNERVYLSGNSAFVGSTGALSTFYGTLPNVSGGNPNEWYIGTGAPSATDSIAAGKGWTVIRSDF